MTGGSGAGDIDQCTPPIPTTQPPVRPAVLRHDDRDVRHVIGEHRGPAAGVAPSAEWQGSWLASGYETETDATSSAWRQSSWLGCCTRGVLPGFTLLRASPFMRATNIMPLGRPLAHRLPS